MKCFGCSSIILRNRRRRARDWSLDTAGGSSFEVPIVYTCACSLCVLQNRSPEGGLRVQIPSRVVLAVWEGNALAAAASRHLTASRRCNFDGLVNVNMSYTRIHTSAPGPTIWFRVAQAWMSSHGSPGFGSEGLPYVAWATVDGRRVLLWSPSLGESNVVSRAVIQACIFSLFLPRRSPGARDSDCQMTKGAVEMLTFSLEFEN